MQKFTIENEGKFTFIRGELWLYQELFYFLYIPLSSILTALIDFLFDFAESL